MSPMTTTGTDLATRADVHALLARFYGRVLVDDLLAAPFTDVREKGLDAHLPVMCDFWETMLFRAGTCRGNAFNDHDGPRPRPGEFADGGAMIAPGHSRR